MATSCCSNVSVKFIYGCHMTCLRYFRRNSNILLRYCTSFFDICASSTTSVRDVRYNVEPLRVPFAYSYHGSSMRTMPSYIATKVLVAICEGRVHMIFSWSSKGTHIAHLENNDIHVHLHTLHFQSLRTRVISYPSHFAQSKKISNDQELIQLDPISFPQNQKGNN